MTRINCIDPKLLTSPHLLAEYRELPRIFTLADSVRISMGDQPKQYVMGTGHMLFFYDKLKYLVKRQIDIIDEMRVRGMAPQFDALGLVAMNDDRTLYNDWEPDLAAQRTNLSRLIERDPDHYRKVRLK